MVYMFVGQLLLVVDETMCAYCAQQVLFVFHVLVNSHTINELIVNYTANYMFLLLGYGVHSYSSHFLYICKNCCNFATAKTYVGDSWGGNDCVQLWLLSVLSGNCCMCMWSQPQQ